MRQMHSQRRRGGVRRVTEVVRIQELERRVHLAVQLPGMQLVDPTVDRFDGQIVYLDFDGAKDVTYRGPVTVGPFGLPAYVAPVGLEGQEQAIRQAVRLQLRGVFGDAGMQFTLVRPDSGTEYSTIYIGGTDSPFRSCGSFLGLAEGVDVGGRDVTDNAFIFSEAVSSSGGPAVYVQRLVAVIAHEVGHLIGYAHTADSAGSVLATVAYSEETHQVLAGSAIQLYEDLFGVSGVYLECASGASAMVGGATDEDNGVNWMNHFCDGGDGSELATGLAGFSSAYTVADANRFPQARSATALADRYAWLGRTMHLIQDMCVPAHVHDDGHPISDSYEGSAYGNRSLFALSDSLGYWDFQSGSPGANSWSSYTKLWERWTKYGTLESLFRETADYTDDYDSDDERGDYHNSETVFPSSRLTELGRTYHQTWARDNVLGGDQTSLSTEELQYLACDVGTWAVEQSAMLMRFFYYGKGWVVGTPGELGVVSTTKTSISLDWGDVSGADGYVVYRWDGTQFRYHAKATSSAYTDTGLSQGMQYYYRVFAYNSTGGLGTQYVEASGVTQSDDPVKVTSPNGGQTWYRGLKYDITWTAKPEIANVKIDLMRGASWENLVSSTLNDGLWEWTKIPDSQALGSDYQIRVSDASSSAVSDTSDGYFTISFIHGDFTLTSPNGGESWQMGSRHTITWESTGPAAKVRIKLFQNDSLIAIVVASTDNDGKYNWDVDEADITPGTGYTLYIEDSANHATNDESDGTFTILAPINVVSPSGGSVVTLDSTCDITWDAVSSISTVNIDLLKGGTPVQTLFAGSTNDSTESWPVPNTLVPGDDYAIRITSSAKWSWMTCTGPMFTISPGNNPPTDIALSNTSVAENQPAGTVVGVLSGTDPDAGQSDTLTFALVSGDGSIDNGSFTIDPAMKQLRTNAVFDYEAKSGYSIRVRTTDQGGLPFEKAFSITVTNVNDRPTDIALSGTSVGENQPSGTVVGTLSSIDPDAGDTCTYTLVSGDGSTDNASFTIAGNQLKTAAPLAAGSRNIRVRTTDSGGLGLEKAFTITVTVAPIHPPVINPQAFSVPENSVNGTVVGTVVASDPDAGQVVGYAIMGGNTGGAFAINSATGQITVATSSVLNYEVTPTLGLTVQVTDNGIPARSASATVTVNLTNVNESPSDIALSNATVAENQPAGTVVGTLSGTDPDAGQSATLVFTLVSGYSGNSFFSIDPATKQLKTAAVFVYATKWRYSIKVTATDSGNPSRTYDETFTIRVTTDLAGYWEFDEGAGTTSADLSGNTNNGTLLNGAAFVSGMPGGAVHLDGVDDYVDLGTAGTPANPTTLTQSAWVRTTAPDGPILTRRQADDGSDWPTLYIESGKAVQMVDDKSYVNRVIGTTNLADGEWHLIVGVRDGSTYRIYVDGIQQNSISNSHPTDGSTAHVYLGYHGAWGKYFTGDIDRVRIWNRALSAAEIAGLDANVSPEDISLSASVIAENQASGAAIGTLSTTDPNLREVFTYGLVSGAGSTDNASFSISGSTLQTAASFNYEGRNSYSIRVRSTDSGGLFVEKALAITVTDVNEAPTDISLSSSSVAENQPSGTAVGTLSTTDPDAGDIFTYVLVSGADSTDNGLFTISGGTLQTGAVFNYESRNSYSIRVRTTDAGGLSYEKAFPISVTNVNEAPTDIALSAGSTPENQPSGTTIGILGTADPDVGDTFTYTLVSGGGSTDNGLFTISSGTLQTAAVFNYESRNSYSIRVRSTDSGSLFFEKAFAITVTNQNDAPTDIALSNATVEENQPAGTTVGSLSTMDEDGGDRFTYSLVSGTGSANNALFTISGSTLQTATVLDYEATSSYSIRVRSTDQGGLYIENALTINVMDLREFGMQQGKPRPATIVDSDGDMATFSLGGGGTGTFQPGNRITLAGTGATSTLTIKVKKGAAGDGVYHLSGINSDGLIKSISGTAVVLSGQMLLNTLNHSAGKASVSMKFRQISDADIQVQGLPVASIAVSGDVSGSRISTTGSIEKFSAATLLDSDVLVGVATDFEGEFAGHGDFTNTAAKLGSLKIAGRKLAKGQAAPPYVANSHISAPSVGTVTLMNVPSGSDAVVHVMKDVGVLQVSQSKLVNEPMFGSGAWKVAGVRPAIWEVV